MALPTPAEVANEAVAAKWLGEHLPADPMPALEEWMAEATARKIQPNPNAMTLATVDADGRPSARIVLCRGIDLRAGFVEFFTNKTSRKGRALHANPHAALLFHWDDLDRQVRIEGPISDAPDARADEYFASRHPLSRLSAWASEQSRPAASRAEIDANLASVAQRFGVDLDTVKRDPSSVKVDIPRPPHWGGYRVWAERVELWSGRTGRTHDRALWTRTLTRTSESDLAFSGSGWRSQRLQP